MSLAVSAGSDRQPLRKSASLRGLPQPTTKSKPATTSRRAVTIVVAGLCDQRGKAGVPARFACRPESQLQYPQGESNPCYQRERLTC